MAGLPKKYAKLGFKKGWKAYKAAKSPKSKSRSKTMGRKKTSKKYYSKGIRPEALALGGLVYGAVRQDLSKFAAPVTAKVPVLGNLSEEVLFGLVHYYGAKKAKGKMLKDFFRAGLSVEAALIGQGVRNGQLGTGGNNDAGSWF